MLIYNGFNGPVLVCNAFNSPELICNGINDPVFFYNGFNGPALICNGINDPVLIYNGFNAPGLICNDFNGPVFFYNGFNSPVSIHDGFNTPTFIAVIALTLPPKPMQESLEESLWFLPLLYRGIINIVLRSLHNMMQYQEYEGWFLGVHIKVIGIVTHRPDVNQWNLEINVCVVNFRLGSICKNEADLETPGWWGQHHIRLCNS